MISNVENTIAWLRVNELKYWRVSLTEGDNSKVFESDDTKPLEAEFSRFRTVMELSQGGRYFIQAADTKEAKRGKYAEQFKNTSEASVPTANAAGIGSVNAGYTKEDLDAAREAAKIELRKEIETEAMRAELAEIRKELSGRNEKTDMLIDRLLTYGQPLIAGLIQKFIPAPTPVAMAGIQRQQVQQAETQQTEVMNDENEITTTDEETERIENALQRLARVEPQYIELLEKISAMAETGDQMYTMARGFLMK